jgi:chromosome segregation ATPase
MRPALALPPLALALGLGFLASTAVAQSDQEARLRESLRRVTADLRAIQDSQAKVQSELAEAQAQREQFRRQLTTAQGRVAELEKAAAQPPPSREPPPEMVAELERLRTAVTDNQARMAAAQQQWQAQAVAQQRELATRLAEEQQGRARSQKGLDICIERNTVLFSASRDVLRAYEDTDFRSLLLGNVDPVLGLRRVRLENVIQDMEDKLYDGRVPKDLKQGQR